MVDAWSQRLSEYIDGSLSEREQIDLMAHLQECADCRDQLAALTSVVAWLKSDDEDDVDPSNFDAIRARIVQRRSRLPIVIPWATAAMLAVIAGSLWLDGPKPVAQTSYQRAVADLEQVLREGQGQLDLETRHKLASSIALVDQAITQSEEALAEDSGNEFVSRHLGKLRKARLEALRDAAAVVRAEL